MISIKSSSPEKEILIHKHRINSISITRSTPPNAAHKDGIKSRITVDSKDSSDTVYFESETEFDNVVASLKKEIFGGEA